MIADVTIGDEEDVTCSVTPAYLDRRNGRWRFDEGDSITVTRLDTGENVTRLLPDTVLQGLEGDLRESFSIMAQGCDTKRGHRAAEGGRREGM